MPAPQTIPTYNQIQRQTTQPLTQQQNPNTCIYCHKQTRRTYRDTRFDKLDNNLIACCQSCADEREYLMISLIFKQADQ